MSVYATIKFACPHCLGMLMSLEKWLHCRECGATFPIVDGIPLLTDKGDYYFGESIVKNRSAMQRVLESLKSEHWDRRIMEVIGHDEALVLYMFEEARGGFKFLLPLDSKLIALDVGSGYGVISISLARHLQHVVALDLTWERLLFARWLSKHKGISNITFVAGGDTRFLPFPNNMFDIVILNGVLEWIPKSLNIDKCTPNEIQHAFLKEIGRVLKPKGVLYIGIENRFAWQYWVGTREEHTGLPFISIIPRNLADIYSRCFKNEPYCTWTPSLPSFKSMLKRAGFHNVCITFAFPHYGMPCWFVGEEQKQPYFSHRPKTRIKAAIHRFLNSPTGKRCWPMLKYFVPSFAATASQSAHPPPPFIHELTKTVSNILFNRIEKEAEVCRYETGLQGERVCAIMLHFPMQHSKVFVKLPLTSYGELYAKRNYDSLLRLYALGLPVPKPLGYGRLQNQKFFIEEFVEASPATELSHRTRQSFKNNALQFLVDLYHKTQREIGPDEATTLMQPMLDAVCRYASRVAPKYISDVKKLKDLILRALSSVKHTVVGHGDFWLGNILASPTGQIKAVIDWNVSVDQCVPGLDLACYLILEEVYFHHQKHLQKIPPEQRDYMPILVALARSGFLDEHPLMSEYLRAIGWSHVDTRLLLLMEAIRQFAYRLSLFPYPLTRRCLQQDFIPLVELVRWYEAE